MTVYQNYNINDYEHILGISINELLYAIRQCIDNPEFRVGIFIQSREVRLQCADFIVRVLREMNCSYYRSTNSNPFIIIENTSIIRLPFVTDNSRGIRFCIALINDDVDQRIKRDVIEPAIRPYSKGFYRLAHGF